ncbi:unnamed protein product [Ectocarpus sp. 12 AP-2014]
MYRYLLCCLVVFAPPSEDDVPCIAFRLRGWAAADSTSPTNKCRSARPTSRGCLACCAGAEVAEDPAPDTPYCPVENRFKQRQAPGLSQSNGATCEAVSVQVKNSSGAKIAIYWLDADDREEFKQSIGLEETRVVLACRGHVWRARDASSGSPGRRRLLSEMTVPPSVHQASSTSGSADIPAVASPNEEEVSGNGYRWEVLACAGFPLPKAFNVVSSLGGLGHFALSRGALGRGLTGLQEATVKQSTDIEGLVSITLEEAFVGKDVAVNIRRRVPCPECHGYGAASFVPCDRCGGSGRRIHDISLSNDDTPPRSIPVMEHGASGCGRSGGSGEGGPHTNSTGSACVSHECGHRDRLGGGIHRGGGCHAGHVSCNGKSYPPCRRPDGEDVCVEGTATDDDNDEGGATDRLRLTRTADCARCGGSGMVPTPSTDGGPPLFCSRCTGARFVEETVDLVLSIPAGVENGHTEVYLGEGHVDLGDLLDTLKPRASSEEANMGDADTGKASGPSPAPPPCSSRLYQGASSINSRWASPTFSPSSSSFSPFSPTTSPGSSASTSRIFYASPPKKKMKTGNFRLTVDVLPHSVFSPAEEGGADLHATVSISVAEALTGFTRDITGLDGSMVTVRRTSRTLPGMTLRFPGLGMPSYSLAEKKHLDERAGSARRSGRGETLPGQASQAVEAGSEGLRDWRARDRRMLEHGDLVVEALVKLPVGMNADRSDFIGSFLKAGSKSTSGEENTADDDD